MPVRDEVLAPSRSWDDLIAHSRRRGRQIRRRQLAAFVAPAVVGLVAAVLLAVSSFTPVDDDVHTVDGRRGGNGHIEGDGAPTTSTTLGEPGGVAPSPSPSTTIAEVGAIRPRPQRSAPGGPRPVAATPAPATVRPLLAFVRGNPADLSGDLYVAQLDGSGARRVVQASGHPSWLPDGTGIVFYRATQDVPSGTIHVVSPDGGSVRTLTTGMYPDVAPDGKRIAFADGERYDGTTLMDLWVANVDGTGRRQLTTTPEGEYSPAWSPDGSRIAFLRVQGSYAAAGYMSLWVMDADGRNQRQLAAIGTGAVTTIAWSPDGKEIAHLCPPANGSGDTDLCVTDLTGRSRQVLTGAGGEYGVAWASDGRSLIVARDADGLVPDAKQELWAVNVDGTAPRRISASALDDFDPEVWPGRR